MFAHKQFVTVLGVLALGFLTTVSTRADTNVNKTTYLTFNRPVSLPGVTLGSGTYIFELPDGTHASDVVRVLSRDRSIIYFTAFTLPVQRPVGMSPNRPITFAEARPDVPQPIAVWWPQDEWTGRQFIYPRH